MMHTARCLLVPTLRRYIPGRAVSSAALSATARQHHRSLYPPTLSSEGANGLAWMAGCLVVIVASQTAVIDGSNPNGTTIITWNHCQIPCGIFDDPGTVQDLRVACSTIRKAVVEGNALHSQYVDTTPLNANQFVRWVLAKEDHADRVIATVSGYCLCQRVKRGNFATEADYLQALQVHHAVMLAAVAVKQSMSLEAVDALDHAVEDLAKMYTPNAH